MSGSKRAADGGDAHALAIALGRVRRERGLTQAALAKNLGASQATISKLLAGQHKPRPALHLAAVRFIGAHPSEDPAAFSNLTLRVEAAARQSVAFRALLEAAVALLNENE